MKKTVLAAAVALVLMTVRLSAHHAFAAGFAPGCAPEFH